jgi:cell wall hydrolase
MADTDQALLARLPAHALLAVTAFLEARSEPVQGIVAVMFTVTNRVARKHYGASIQEVCLWPWQYSCWNLQDPNREIGLRIARQLLAGESLDHEPDAIVLGVCLYLADRVLYPATGPVRDPTRQATHYFNPTVSPRPAWARPASGAEQTARIGAHVFFRGVA